MGRKTEVNQLNKSLRHRSLHHLNGSLCRRDIVIQKPFPGHVEDILEQCRKLEEADSDHDEQFAEGL